MRNLVFLGMAVSLTLVSGAAGARDSRAVVVRDDARFQGRALHHRWGPRVQGRWYAGWRAPGGWASYRIPVRGYVVPPYWIAPSFYIGNYAQYGFTPPPQGLAWSRYYDDAVLIDGRGTVYDRVTGVDWDGDGDFEGSPPPPRAFDRDAGTLPPPPRYNAPAYLGCGEPGVAPGGTPAPYYDYGYRDERVTAGGRVFGARAGMNTKPISTWQTKSVRRLKAGPQCDCN